MNDHTTVLDLLYCLKPLRTLSGKRRYANLGASFSHHLLHVGFFCMALDSFISLFSEQISMAMRVLVIFYKFAQMTKRFLANKSSLQLGRGDGHYTEVLSSEEIAELSRIFRSFFNHRLMGSIGITISDDKSHELVKVVLESVSSGHTKDGNAIPILSNDAFFQWYANRLSNISDKRNCAEFLFSLFDEDNSGDITMLEFKQQLDNLAIGITHEEAQEMIQELDSDGNGVLCRKEFEEMLEHFYPPEFKHHAENWEAH